MTSYEKLLKKFLENPEKVDLKGILKILKKNGFEERKGKGSHCVFSKGEKNLVLPIHNNDCKGKYKLLVFKILFDKNK